jgi:hypothetical protein
LFETLWNKALPAEQRTKEIEEIKEIEKTEVLYGPEEAINEGIDIEKTEIVYDPLKAKALYLELVDSAKYEILLVFPSISTFQRVYSIGIVEKLLEKSKSSASSSSGNHVHVRSTYLRFYKRFHFRTKPMLVERSAKIIILTIPYFRLSTEILYLGSGHHSSVLALWNGSKSGSE